MRNISCLRPGAAYLIIQLFHVATEILSLEKSLSLTSVDDNALKKLLKKYFYSPSLALTNGYILSKNKLSGFTESSVV